MKGSKLTILYKDSDKKEKVRCLVDKWTFQDRAMSVGGQFITFTIVSEIPIPFAIGDYCEYRGVTYYLNNLPSVDQTAKPKRIGNAFKYDGVRFDSVSNDLGRVTMLDITPTTGDYVAAMGTNYTGSATFQLFCGEKKAIVQGKTVTYTPVCTLAGKMQANLDRAFPKDGWHIRVNLSSTEVKKGVVQLVTHTDDKVLSFNNTTVASALAEVQNTFKLDYFIKGRDIYIGYTLGAVTSDQSVIDETSANKKYFYFGYGKGYADEENQGKALFEVKRTVNTSQQIITRLRAMGSTKNMPYRYYNKQYNLSQSLFPQNLQLPDTFETPEVKAKRNVARKEKYPFLRSVLGDTNDAYIDKNDDCLSTKEGLREGSAQWDGSNQDLEEIYPTIKEATYGELRTAECEDMDGHTEVNGGTPDSNGHKSFLNYEDTERIDEILAVGYLADGKLIDNAHVGNGIIPQEGAVYPYEDKNAVISENTINGANIQNAGGQYSTGEVTLFTIENQNAGSYFMAASFGHIWAGVKYYSSHGGVIEAGYRIKIYATPKSTNKEKEIGMCTVFVKDVKNDSSDFSEFELPHLPDVTSKHPQIESITLTEKSDVRVTFEIVFYRREYFGTDYSLTYFVGKSKKAVDLPTDYKSQYRWAEVQYADNFLNTPFNIIIKDLGIKDWKAQFNSKDKPMLVMSDGRCVAREFEIGDDVKRVTYTKNGKKYNGWQLRLTRASDTSLHTYYPSETDRLQAGDHFVLTGIMMPDVYIKAAEVRLLTAATQYLADNCETKYTYEPHLDDIYLTRNFDKCEEAGDVTKSVYWNLYAGLRFPFLGIPETSDEKEVLPIINITMETITIKEGDGLTPKVEITLNDKIEQSTYQKITTAVDRIYNGSLFSQLGIGGGGLTASDVTMLIKRLGDASYISKTSPDTAQEIITFLKGIILGRNYSIDGDGNAILNLIKSVGIENTGDFITKNLTVTGMMKVFKLIIDEVKSAGGALIMTPADGFTVDKVVPVGTDGAELKSTEEIFNLFTVGGKYIGVEDGALADIRTVHKEVDESKIAGYRLYWKATDGSKARRNMWKVEDQALCKTDNLADGTTYNAANKEYWCAVTDRNQDGKPVSVEIDGQLYDCNYITISTTNKLKDCVVNPAVGDEIVMLGYQGTDDAERQSAIYMSAYSSMDTGLRAPLLGFYQGVNDFDLASHRTSYFDARKGKFVGEFEVVTESGSVPIEDYIKDKASIDIDTYRLMPSTTVINTGRDESALLSVVHQTGKVSEIISKPTDGFYILADFYDLNGKPFSGASFEIGDEITSQLFKDLKASRVVLTLQKLVGVNQLKDLDKCAVTTVADGEGGTDGKGIKTVTAHYGLSASPSAEPTEWKDTPQVMTPEKRYLWSYETTVYTDNTKKDTAKHIIGVYGDSGKNGVDGYTAYLSPARITLDTDSNGMVPNAKIKDAKAVIHVINGSNEISIGDINAVSLEAKGCTAVTDTVTIGARRYMCVKLDTIESVTDESGTYTNPLSTVDVTVTLNSGAVLVARMEVAINLHKVMATLKVEQNKITQRVTATETATEQLSNGVATLNTRVTELQTADGQILAQVKTVKDTVDGHTDSISQLAVRQGEIALSVKEASAPRNLLTGTAFRFDKDFTQNNVDYPCHVSETERYKGTNSVVIDVNEANAVYSGIILKSLVISPGISYTFSFLSKTVAGHEPDVFYYEVQAFKKDGSQSVKYRLAGGNIHRSEEWARTTSTFVTAEDVNYIKVIIFINKSGKAYIARPMLEEGDKYTGWTLSVDDDIKAVQGAGVNLNKERIELNGRTVFIGSDGNELAVFDNGKIEANLIDAKKIVATGIQAQTIDAKNAVFKNLTVEGDSTFKGTINAKSGNIAGFNIESNVLKNIVEENSPIAGSSIIINDKFSGIFSGIGTDVVPATSGYRVAAAFESTSQNNSMNVAARFIASGASVENVALLIPNGVIKGFRRYFRVVDANTTLKNTDSTILVRNNDLAITLPANCEDGQEYTIYLSSVHMTLTASGNDNIGLVTKNGGLSFSLIRQKTYGFDNEVMRISVVYDRIQQVWMVSRDIAK